MAQELTPDQQLRRQRCSAVREGTSNVCKMPLIDVDVTVLVSSLIALCFCLVQSTVCVCVRVCVFCGKMQKPRLVLCVCVFEHIIMPNRGGRVRGKERD